MAQQMTDTSCREFARTLAAKQPIPGGGAAAALVGALAVSLCSMAGNYTLGKKRYADVESDIERILVAAMEVREVLLGLMEKDAQAFEPLSRAYGIPKGDPTRAAVLEEATKNACVPPLEMMQLISKTIELLEEMSQKGSRMLVSDVGCGAYLAVAALQSAAINVYVNTRSYRGRAWADEADAQASTMLNTYVPRGEAIACGVTDSMRGHI